MRDVLIVIDLALGASLLLLLNALLLVRIRRERVELSQFEDVEPPPDALPIDELLYGPQE